MVLMTIYWFIISSGKNPVPQVGGVSQAVFHVDWGCNHQALMQEDSLPSSLITAIGHPQIVVGWVIRHINSGPT